MPKLEALDNKGNPTGYYKFFSDSAYARIRALKKPHWRLAEKEQPKQSRSNPVPAGKTMPVDFPLSPAKQHEWVAATDDKEKLQLALMLTTSPAVKKAIEDKLSKPTQQ